MDIDFIIQDIFALTRPQWKLVANFEEAGRAFAELVTQNYKNPELDKIAEPEIADDDASSEEDADDEELQVPDMEDAHSSSEEADNEVSERSLLVTAMLTFSSLQQTVIQRQTLILGRTLLSLARKKRETPKRKPTSIESLQK